MIWYSEYYEIFQNIFNEKEIKNKIPYLEKINNIEFDTYFNYLTSIFFSDNKFNETEFNNMISTLNAQMLFKIYQIIIKDNLDLLDISNLLFETIQNLDSLINELMERKEKDKNEIIWAYNIISHYPIDFNLILPNFEPKDVKYLFIHLNDNKKNISEGPLIKNLLFDIELYYHKFYDEEYNNFKETFFNISKNFLSLYYKKKSNKIFETQIDYEEFKLKLLDCLNNTQNQNEIELLKRIYIFQLLFEKYEFKNYNLKYDDIYFLQDKKWISNKDLIKNYPSFYFWLCKHYDSLKEINNKFNYNIKEENNSIPFFIIPLRIISSNNCVDFEEDLNQYSKKIINPIIKKGFNDKTCENLSILINLMMLNVDKIDKTIKKEILTQLFILINQLWDNEHEYCENNYILKIQCDFESKIAQILYSSIFNNNLMTLFDKEIKSNDLLFYIFSPDNYLFEKFNNLKTKSINEIYNNQYFEMFIKNFEAQKNNLLIYSSLIKNSIIDEIQYKIYERKVKTKNIIENIIESHEKFNYQNQENLEKLRCYYLNWGKYLKNISNNKKWKKVFYIEYNIINNDDLFLVFKNIEKKKTMYTGMDKNERF